MYSSFFFAWLMWPGREGEGEGEGDSWARKIGGKKCWEKSVGGITKIENQ